MHKIRGRDASWLTGALVWEGKAVIRAAPVREFLSLKTRVCVGKKDRNTRRGGDALVPFGERLRVHEGLGFPQRFRNEGDKAVKDDGKLDRAGAGGSKGFLSRRPTTAREHERGHQQR